MRLCGGQTGSGHAEWRTRNIIKPDLFKKADRVRITAMFTADAKLYIGTGFAATLNPHFDQSANPFKVNRHKRINRINLFISIIMQERSGIVTADAK